MPESRDQAHAELPWHEILGWIVAEVRAAARHYRLPDGERDELQQQVSLRVLKSLAGFDRTREDASLQTWVRRHAGWGVADYWRQRLGRERRETPMEIVGEADETGRGASPEHAAYRRELRSALETCLAKLTPAQRERFLLAEKSLGASTTLPALAAHLRISRDTLKETLKRARELMRRCLRGAGFSPASDLSLPPAGGKPSV